MARAARRDEPDRPQRAKPRKPGRLRETSSFFSWRELSFSILQGLAITAGSLFTYWFSVQNGFDEAYTRTLVFTVLIAANIFLTLVNRSFYYSIFTTIRYKNSLVPMIIGITVSITGLLLFVKPLTAFFDFETPTTADLGICLGIGFVSVIWIEFVKWWRRR